MAFSEITQRTRARFSEVVLFLNYIKSLEPDDPTQAIIPEIKVMRGLFYVHLYGAIEKSVNDAVETTLMLLAAKNVKNKHYSRPLLSLVFHDQVKALKDTGYGNLINKSVDLFCESNSENIIRVTETALSRTLQNIWFSTIEEIVKIFGIENISFSPREIATINEIVEKRNAVAHGRDSAMNIGERHGADVLRTKMDIAVGVIQSLHEALRLMYENKSYLINEAQPLYNNTN